MACIFILSGLLGTAVTAQDSRNRDSAGVAARNPAFPGSETETRKMEFDAQREKLSLAWTFLSLNMVGADVLSTFIPGKDAEVEAFAGGKKNIKWFMLGGAVIYEVPFSMILFSRYLPYTANRWANVGAAAFATLVIIGGGSWEPHYVFIATVETLTLSWIAYTALKMPDPRAHRGDVPGKAGTGGLGVNHDVGLNLNAERELYGLKYSYTF